MDMLIENPNEVEIILTENPYYYAIVLQEFISNANGRTTAVLFDLDGCGDYEMIAFDEGISENDEWHSSYADGGRITIYDIKTPNNPSTIELRFLINRYDIYISNKNYIILSDYWEGILHQIFRYEKGTIINIAYLEYSVMGTYAPFFWINDTEIEEAQFNDYLDNFDVYCSLFNPDIGDIGIFISSSLSGIPLQDDTVQILAMMEKIED
jgi:hypothetical protein